MNNIGNCYGHKECLKLLKIFTRMILEELKDRLISVVLYGSVARQEAKPESDIDILIVQSQVPDEYYKRIEPILSAEKRLRDTRSYREFEKKGRTPYLSYLILSEDEAKENRYIFLDMIYDSVILFDRDGFFKRRLEEMNRSIKCLGSKKVYMDNGTWYWDLKPDLVAGEVFEL